MFYCENLRVTFHTYEPGLLIFFHPLEESPLSLEEFCMKPKIYKPEDEPLPRKIFRVVFFMRASL